MPNSAAPSGLRSALPLAPLGALILLVVAVFALPPVDVAGDLGYEMMNIAESLARNAGFSDPMTVLPTGPTATQPPLYPLFLALLIKVLRNGDLLLLAINVATIFAGAATAMLLHSLVRRLLGPVAAHFAAGLWLASSWMGDSPNWIFWDAAFTPLVLLGFCYATVDPAEQRGFIRACILPGTLLGALFLLNPASLVIALIWWAGNVVLWGGPPGLRGTPSSRFRSVLPIPTGPTRGSAADLGVRPTRIKKLQQTAGILVVAALIGVPWIVRNYAIWGRFIVREGFGYSFYTSNNPCAAALLGINLSSKCHEQTHPNENVAEAETMRRLGEPEYDRMKTAATWDWIRANPRRFAELTAKHILFFWFPTWKEYRFQAYSTWLVTLLSIPGLLGMRRKHPPLAAFVAATSVLYPAVYYMIVADIRYRAPFGWVAVLPAAFLCAQLRAKITATSSR